ncbi:FtsK/SpoIIIE family DNA translocase [Sediminibacterium goheungense]|uniref:S-DNA-T family DNA segregation ATPase FtsK/SpoIIIE n=1 Tax=Sediminibacterium goheungense TaxID=1086393 RepID=A0A4R6IYT3_9BACT|nr:DNA translocase FtsK [Sediminibacterium goheungense]TDO28024.1 S-DNA-T family DNA segregation ATPase FtsK/SpoIIIE [Sediminibacterium goheungense]
MANRLKKKTPPPPSPEELNPDKEPEVTVTEVVKDERTTKILGASSLLLTIFLFVAFTSYLFTWQEDQDKVHQFGIRIFATDDVKVNNLLGVLGAYVAHTLFYKGFGLASYLLCSFFFVLGANLLFGKKIFSLVRNLRYMIVGLVVLSMAFAFVSRASAFSWGGGVGELLNAWFVKWIGNIGTGALLLLSVFSYVIWRFNPTFTIPDWQLGKNTAKAHEDDFKLSIDDEVAVRQEWDENADIVEQPVVEEKIAAPNKLKSEGSGVVVIMPQQEEEETDPMNEFDVTEKDLDEQDEDDNLDEEEEEENVVFEEEVISKPEPLINVIPPAPVKKTDIDNTGLELEINETPEVEEEAAPAPVPGKLNTKYDVTLDLKDYKYPGLDLLETHGSEKIVHDPTELETNKNQIIATLKNYDIAIQRIAATVGPTVTLYEIVPAPGVRISRIKNLEDDIALSLAALGIRIIAPIPGKGTIGIEVPNVRKTVVSMKTLLASEKFQSNAFSLPIAIGKKIDNENFIVDLASMPHLLMAGATGQGKSVGLNAILVSLLYKKHPSQLKFVLVDPKKVELSLYRVIEKHFLAKLPGEEESIITDTKKVVHTLNALCIEMDNRYDLLKEAGCRNIREYNEKFTARKLNPEKGHQYLPFIVLVVDEFADLIMTAGKEVEMPIARLAQLARAIGIHLIIATQRPSVNIITGTIKANFPARIAFKVSSKIDSRTILDAGGAEQLIGKGDMLVSYNGEITRLQCAFVDTPEVENVCEFIGDQRGYPQAFLLPEYVDEKEMDGRDFDASERDPLFEDAARLIVQSQMGSTSLIQRRMKLGYNRAGRLMDQLEAAGVVGPNQGSKAREVLFKTDMELQEFLDSM